MAVCKHRQISDFKELMLIIKESRFTYLFDAVTGVDLEGVELKVLILLLIKISKPLPSHCYFAGTQVFFNIDGLLTKGTLCFMLVLKGFKPVFKQSILCPRFLKNYVWHIN